MSGSGLLVGKSALIEIVLLWVILSPPFCFDITYQVNRADLVSWNSLFSVLKIDCPRVVFLIGLHVQKNCQTNDLVGSLPTFYILVHPQSIPVLPVQLFGKHCNVLVVITNKVQIFIVPVNTCDIKVKYTLE